MNKAFFPLPLILALSLPAGAQTAGVPQLGWLAGAGSRSVRPVFGVPGSARVGPESGLPEGVRLLAFHPAAPRAVVLIGDAGDVGWVRMTAEETAVSLLPGAYPTPDISAWSPSGKALLLAWRELQLAQVWTASDEGFSMREELPFTAQAAAVSDDGAAVLLLDGSALSLHRDGGTFVAAEPGAAAGFAFLAGSASFVYAAGHELIVHDGSAEIRRIPLASEAASDSRSMFLLSPSVGRILTVQSGEGIVSSEIRLWSDTGDLLASSECPCRVLSIRGVGQAGMYWLQSEGDGPAWFSDLSPPTPRIFFVPPAVVEAAEGGDR